jgi:O-antigen/teichoic acid export membrane protein
MTIESASSPRLVSQAWRLILGRGLAALVSAIWFVVAARLLSLSDFGELALLISLGLMTSIVGDLGLTNLLSEEVAVDHGVVRAATRHVVRQRLGLGAVSVLLTIALYAAAGGSWPLAALFGVSTLATVVYSTYTAAFRALGRAQVDAANELGSRLLVLGVGWVFLAAGDGLTAAVVAYVVGDLASLVILSAFFAVASRGAVTPLPRRRVGIWRARSLAATGVVNTVYQRVDVWLLAMLSTATVVANYAAAYRCFDALLLPSVALALLSVPYTAGTSGAGFGRRVNRLALGAFAITAPIAVVVSIAAHPIVTTLFGERYAPAATPLRLLAIGAMFTAPIFATAFPLALRSTRVPVALALAFAANVVANLAVIPRYEAKGAAWVTVLCDLALLTWVVTEIRRLAAPQRVTGATENRRPAADLASPLQNPAP